MTRNLEQNFSATWTVAKTQNLGGHLTLPPDVADASYGPANHRIYSLINFRFKI